MEITAQRKQELQDIAAGIKRFRPGKLRIPLNSKDYKSVLIPHMPRLPKRK